MDADRAIAIIEAVLGVKSLNSVQIQIVRGVMAGNSYQEIALMASAEESVSPPQYPLVSKPSKRLAGQYQVGYLRETGAQLWQSLSQRLGRKVTKKSLGAILLWYAKQSQSIATVDDVRSAESIATRIDAWECTSVTGDRFYGRTEELAILTDWCLYERCRSIFLIGMGGMGKTTLARAIADNLSGYFQLTIWRSLLYLPPVTELCGDLLRVLNPQLLLELPTSLESQIELLISCLQRDRCLLILDNVESILQGQVQGGQYLPGYEGYDRLFRAISELPHQSCTIFTGREKPHTIARSQIIAPQQVRSMTVNGMTLAAGHQLIQAYGCPPLPAPMWQEVHAHYAGNPLALKIATIAAVEMTGGGEKMLELYPLMKQGQLQFRNIDDVLQRQFDRLSDLEQQLVYWLAIAREPIAGMKLRSHLLLNTTMPGEIINALQSLSRRCITVCQDGEWSLQPVTIAYVTRRSIERFVSELSPDFQADLPLTDLPSRFCHLNTYAIVQTDSQYALRQMQIQSILRPILDRLLAVWGDRSKLDRHLQQILTLWQTQDPIPTGYLAANLQNLRMELEP
jgi:SpoVK/Ycf46/Vps4 family AAA+-type ATPase